MARKRNLIGMYRDLDIAERLVSDLLSAGVPRDRISIVSHHASERYRDLATLSDEHRKENTARGAGGGAAVGAVGGALLSIGLAALPGVGWILAAGPIGSILATGGIGALAGAAVGGIGGALSKAGVPERQAQHYAEAVRRGGALIAVEAEEADAPQVAEVMERYEPVDMDRSAKRWQEEGWSPEELEQKPFSEQEVHRERAHWARESGVATPQAGQGRTPPTSATPPRPPPQASARGEDKTVPVVEEHVDVNKRDVVRGGTRIHIHPVSETFEQDVRLREERADVQRRKVDRPASAEEQRQAFQDETIEVVEHGEEPVVHKEARVVEEVHVGKHETERTEHVREQVRHTEVEIERLSPQEFAQYEPRFRQHFRGLGHGDDFESHRPAYELGVTLARDGRFEGRSRDWSEIEPLARTRWEKSRFGHTMPYDRVRDSIAYGYDEARKMRV